MLSYQSPLKLAEAAIADRITEIFHGPASVQSRTAMAAQKPIPKMFWPYPSWSRCGDQKVDQRDIGCSRSAASEHMVCNACKQGRSSGYDWIGQKSTTWAQTVGAAWLAKTFTDFSAQWQEQVQEDNKKTSWIQSAQHGSEFQWRNQGEFVKKRPDLRIISLSLTRMSLTPEGNQVAPASDVWHDLIWVPSSCRASLESDNSSSRRVWTCWCRWFCHGLSINIKLKTLDSSRKVGEVNIEHLPSRDLRSMVAVDSGDQHQSQCHRMPLRTDPVHKPAESEEKLQLCLCHCMSGALHLQQSHDLPGFQRN